MPKHPPEAQSGPTPNSSQQPAESQPTDHTGENLVRFWGSQVIPAIQIIQPAAAKRKQSTPKRRTPRQEERLARLEETRESRAHLGDTTPLPATPQGLYHFERLDQIKTLVEARQSDPERAYMLSLLALCSMARTDPGRRQRYIRKNGPWTLIISAGGEDPRLPYGIIPRLLLAWICTQAVLTQSPHLVLGHSLTDFMKDLGLHPTAGGKRGDRTRLQDQMERLFRASVELIYKKDGHNYEVADHVTTVRDLWWNPKRSDEPVLWASTITLGAQFFAEIIARPVPIDMHILRAMKRSSFGLDLYLWLTYKLHRLTHPERLPLPLLYRQFAASPDRTDNVAVQNFRKDLLRELAKLHTAWPQFKYRLTRGRLELRPTPPRIPPHI